MSISCTLQEKVCRALNRALNCIRYNAAEKLQCKSDKRVPSRKRYAQKEPKLDTKQMYVKFIKQKIAQKPSLRRKLLNAFKSVRKPLAEKIKTSKLTYAVSRLLLYSHHVLVLL